MKGWKEYFKKEDQSVNEDHKETREEQVEWICETLKELHDEEIKRVYDFIENGMERTLR